MSGYANRVRTITFKELTPDDEPPIHVVLRNPQLMPPDELSPEDVQLDEHGRPTDVAAAKRANDKVLAKLIIGWRVFDATDVRIDADGNELDQEPLPLPATPELVAKLPTVIWKALVDEVGNALNPQ
jgi:hypothetical protein